MLELLTFILCAYGLTQIVVYSDMPILKKIRPPKDWGKGYGKVFHCPMCMGFHIGWFGDNGVKHEHKHVDNQVDASAS